MKNIALVLVLLVSVLSWTQKRPPNPSDYPITVHVSSAQLRDFNGMLVQKLSVTVNAKKCELMAQSRGGWVLLKLGDYPARLVEDKHKTAYESSRKYELLFPDNTTRGFWVNGESE